MATTAVKVAKIRILKPSLDDCFDPPVIRGVIDPECFGSLKIDPSYQRERLSVSSRKEISKAIDLGLKLPDIEIGMRGDHFEMPSNDELFLLGACYIIDGYQRTETLKEHRERYPTGLFRLGAMIHVNTTREFERDRFQALNLFRQRVSPSVLLRNTKEENDAIATLYGLTMSQQSFPLYHKVCWQQNMTQGHVITAMVFAQVALTLHTHIGHVARAGVKEIPQAALRLKGFIGLPLLRANLTMFWELMDSCFGVRDVARRDPATHLRTNFLTVLARVISDHKDFWAGADEKRLAIPDHLKRKLSRFPMTDPEIVRLAGGSGKATETLYYQMVTYINSGKRTKRLTNRHGTIMPAIYEDDDEEAANG